MIRKAVLWTAVLLVSSCTLDVYSMVPEESVTGDCLTIERTGGEAGNIAFSFALPRSHYQDIKWSFSYFSFDSPTLSEAIRQDGEGNPYFEAVADDAGLTRIDHGLFSETTESVVPFFEFHDQAFPEAFGAEMYPYLAPAPGIPSDDPRILAIAAGLKTGNMVETLYTVISFFDDIDYDYNFLDMRPISGNSTGVFRGERGMFRDPFEVLEDRAGGCWEKASLAAAILRACSIPARIVNNPPHGWNEVYLPLDGWIPLDLSKPDRTVHFSLPIPPWNVRNYSNVTAVGGSGVPRLVREWDREIVGRLHYHPWIYTEDGVTSITEVFDDRDVFFGNMRYIVVHPLASADPEEIHFIDFFSARTKCLVYRSGADCILETTDGTSYTISFAGAMTIPVDGVPTQFEFSQSGNFILIKRPI
jgi:transglutaminase-like putative cysteine protease